MVRSLHSGFLRSAARFPDRPALEVGGVALTFAALWQRAAVLAATVQKHRPEGGTRLIAVLAERSPVAFAAILGSLFCGDGYVPLSPKAPADRIRSMLERSGSRVVIVDGRSAELLADVLGGVKEQLLIVLPGHDTGEPLASRWPHHRIVAGAELRRESELCREETYPAVPVAADAPAYLLFTSGSTGVPKGVMVTHANARHLVDVMVDRYKVTEHDRFSQMFDLTFDLSVFDMFVAWEVGACVCCPTGNSLIAPGEFIQSSGLTVWFSVPSTAIIMKRLGLLKPNRYATLRWSLFCGESLALDIARTWADAAPKSTVENLYGPTEATVACTSYRWDPGRSPAESELGLVPIGQPLPGLSMQVVNELLLSVPQGEEGELLIAGPQVAPGYWNDPARTETSFVIPPGQTSIHYRTGDRVRNKTARGPLCYLGRLDNQIQVHGHRVELGEVEANIREIASVDAVVAVGWPPTTGGVSGVVAFLEGDDVDVKSLRVALSRRLPDYMVPQRLRVLPKLPTNSNGKFDRKALIALLDGGR